MPAEGIYLLPLPIASGRLVDLPFKGLNKVCRFRDVQLFNVSEQCFSTAVKPGRCLSYYVVDYEHRSSSTFDLTITGCEKRGPISAESALRGSRVRKMFIPQKFAQKFSLNFKMLDRCDVGDWSLVAFRLKAEGIDSYSIRVGKFIQKAVS